MLLTSLSLMMMFFAMFAGAATWRDASFKLGSSGSAQVTAEVVVETQTAATVAVAGSTWTTAQIVIFVLMGIVVVGVIAFLVYTIWYDNKKTYKKSKKTTRASNV